MTRCTLEHNHRLSGPLRAGRQDPVLPEELLAEHVSALKEWARIPVAVRTQVFTRITRYFFGLSTVTPGTVCYTYLVYGQCLVVTSVIVASFSSC